MVFGVWRLQTALPRAGDKGTGEIIDFCGYMSITKVKCA